MRIFDMLTLLTPTATKPGTILVVDANPLSRQLIRGLLTQAGHRVTCVVDGLSALAQARLIQPAAIVADMTLPGLSGLELVRWLKARPETAAIPVLGLSAFVGIEQAATFLRAGCARFMPKPIVSAAAFLTAIQAMIGGETAPAAAPLPLHSNVVPLRRAS
jgi:two-component system cell cycle response regulator DivK